MRRHARSHLNRLRLFRTQQCAWDNSDRFESFSQRLTDELDVSCKNLLFADIGAVVALSKCMNAKHSNIENDFVITTLPTSLKLLTFLGLAVVLLGFFSPVIRRAVDVVDSTQAIRHVLGDQQPDATN